MNSAMNLDTVTIYLSQRIGIDPKILGDRKIGRAVETRRVACRLSDLDTYFKLLQTSPQEFNHLVEQIVVPETWFFRDRKPFDFLVNFVHSEWLSKSGGAKLRVLSVPCSTGEEPYSIAIALLEAGLPVHRFSVDAIDISHQAIAKAQRAIYGKNSFRGEEWVERSRYFQSVDDKYEVSPLVRQTVTFRQGNLLEAFSSLTAKYHIIFCRNLLIYLEHAICHQVFNTLHHLLLPTGILFVGASETGKVLSDRFSFLRQSFTFAYRKIDSPALVSKSNLELVTSPKTSLTSPKTSLTSPKTSLHSSTESPPQHLSAQLSNQPSSGQPSSGQPSFSQPSFSQSSSGSKLLRQKLGKQAVLVFSEAANGQERPHVRPTTIMPSEISLSTASIPPSLQQAKDLADAGHLEAGIDCCKTYLESHSTNVEAYVLLGTLYQAIAHYEQAKSCFQKALYLHPNHYETLMHFALLKEFQGDEIGAERLRQRLKKLHPPSNPSPP